MAKYIDADTVVSMPFLDDSYGIEKHIVETDTIENLLDRFTKEGCPEPADVTPVVHCRDCAKLNRNGYCTRFQNNISGIATSWFMPDDDDFCSYGERREEQTCTKICIADGIELPIM